jgi:hypothetical protein
MVSLRTNCDSPPPLRIALASDAKQASDDPMSELKETVSQLRSTVAALTAHK